MKRTKVIMLMFGILLVLVAGLVAAHEHDFGEAKQLIDSGVSCDKLTEEQFEEIGDYYMEQMHPGEAHEYMDEMMGGEGSESLKKMHINIARNTYCGESGGMMNGGMMNMMGGGNMMAGNYYSGYNILGWLFTILVITILVLTILLLINKLKGQGKNKHGR